MISEELQFLFSGLCWEGKLDLSASGRAENKDLWAKILVGSLVRKMPWIKPSDKLSYGSCNLSRHHFHTVWSHVHCVPTALSSSKCRRGRKTYRKCILTSYKHSQQLVRTNFCLKYNFEMYSVAPSNAKPNPLDFSCPNDNYIWIKRQLPANSAFVLQQNKGTRMDLGCASGFQNDEFMFITITGSGQQWSHSTHFKTEQKVCSLHHPAQYCQRDEYLSPATSSIIFLPSFKRNLSLGWTHSIQFKRNLCPLINSQQVRKLVWTKGRNSKEKASNIIYCGLSERESAECSACLHWVCWVVLLHPAELWAEIGFLMEKPPHILPFGQVFGSESTLHLWVSNTHFPHEAVSNSGSTKRGRKSVPSTCQTRPLCVQVHMPENKTITYEPNFE